MRRLSIGNIFAPYHPSPHFGRIVRNPPHQKKKNFNLRYRISLQPFCVIFFSMSIVSGMEKQDPSRRTVLPQPMPGTGRVHQRVAMV